MYDHDTLQNINQQIVHDLILVAINEDGQGETIVSER